MLLTLVAAGTVMGGGFNIAGLLKEMPDAQIAGNFIFDTQSLNSNANV